MTLTRTTIRHQEQQTSEQQPGPWKIKPLVGFLSGRPAGFTVERVNAARNNYETLSDAQGRNTFRTESEAQSAIDAA